MAKEWNKLGEKLGAQAEGPTAADWASMEQKIAATPALQPKGLASFKFKLALAAIALLILSSTLLWFNDNSLQNSQNQQHKEEKSSPGSSSDFVIPAERQTSSPESSSPKASESSQPEEIVKPSLILNEAKSSSSETASAIASGSSQKLSITQAKTSTKAKSSKSNPFEDESSLEKASAREQNDELAKISSELMAENEQLPKSVNQGSVALVDSTQLENSQSQNPAINPNPSAIAQSDSTAEAQPNRDQLLSDEGQADKASALLKQETPAALKETFSLPDSSSVANQSNRKEDEVASASSSSEDDFINSATGFRLQQINMALGAATRFNQSNAFGLNFATDFQWERDNWFFQAGLQYHQDYHQQSYQALEDKFLIDSTWALNISNRQQAIITRIWVIDSFNAGHFEVDTTFQTVIDSSIVLNVDTNRYQISSPQKRQIRFQYAELPLLYGYQNQRGAFTYSLAGGISLQQALLINDENYSRSEDFSLALLLQPTISYRLNQHWSTFIRIRLQQQVIDNRLFQTNQNPHSCQLGVSYRW